MIPFDPTPYARGIKEQNEAEARRIEERLAHAREEATRLIERMQREAGCTEVVLFGSVADRSVRTLHFDIDLAVIGGDLSQAEAIAEESSFAVDVVDYARCPPHVRAGIDRHRRR